MSAYEPQVILSPDDTTRRHESRKDHLVKLGDTVLYEASDRAEALTWRDGFVAGTRLLVGIVETQCIATDRR